MKTEKGCGKCKSEGFCPECGNYIGKTIKCGECMEYRDIKNGN